MLIHVQISDLLLIEVNSFEYFSVKLRSHEVFFNSRNFSQVRSNVKNIRARGLYSYGAFHFVRCSQSFEEITIPAHV